MNDTAAPGRLTEEQIQALLQAIKPHRVALLGKLHHMQGYDIRAHLTRIFGFGGWDFEAPPAVCIRDEVLDKGGKPKDNGWPNRRFECAYRQHATLVIKDQYGRVVCRMDGQAIGKAENQPSYGDAHDLAIKDAETSALKRAAVNLGDQFGLSLYSKTKPFEAIVRRTLVGGPPVDGDLDHDIPEVNVENEHEDEPVEQAATKVSWAPRATEPAAPTSSAWDEYRAVMATLAAEQQTAVTRWAAANGIGTTRGSLTDSGLAAIRREVDGFRKGSGTAGRQPKNVPGPEPGQPMDDHTQKKLFAVARGYFGDPPEELHGDAAEAWRRKKLLDLANEGRSGEARIPSRKDIDQARALAMIDHMEQALYPGGPA